MQAALGRRDLKNGDFQAAASHLRRALQRRPPVATTYADLADALAHLGQTEEALPFFEKAIELDPFNPVTRKMLVVRLIELNNMRGHMKRSNTIWKSSRKTISCGRCWPALRGRTRSPEGFLEV